MKPTLAFRAVLLHREGAPVRTVLLPAVTPAAPLLLRVPTSFAGAAAFDEYRLLDGTGWPEQAVYEHAGIVPRTTFDEASDTVEL